MKKNYENGRHQASSSPHRTHFKNTPTGDVHKKKCPPFLFSAAPIKVGEKMFRQHRKKSETFTNLEIDAKTWRTLRAARAT
jgi:hypothetical protein